ncbi:MAG: hypothetical protein FJ253_02535 [Phycisphaerae bacterium]|nr:hypothetical protein [Phycisphaerae bacterium]
MHSENRHATDGRDERDHAAIPAGTGWNHDAPRPSGWVAFWPEPSCPDAEQLESALAHWLEETPEIRRAENPDERGEVAWAFAASVPGIDEEVVFWAERAARGAFGDETELHAALAACPWVIRMQSILGRDDPVADHFVLTALLAGSVPESPAILDASSDAIFDRHEIDSWFLHPQAKPLERLLWSVKGTVVGAVERRIDIRTKGLSRCHRPELEIAGVPEPHLDAAVTLLHAVASLLLEGPMPAPGAAYEIGHGLSVRLARWEIPAESVGDEPEIRARICEPLNGSDDRGEGHASVGSAGAGTADESADPAGRRWSWPRRAIELAESGRAVLFLTGRTSDALREHARRSFPDFATAWAALRRCDDAALREEATRAFRILAPVDPAAKEEIPEHAWFRVDGFEGSMVRASLLDAPLQRADLKVGTVMLIAPELVRGWRADLSGRSFGPDDAPALLREVDRLRGVA